jgi:hypothetical protein
MDETIDIDMFGIEDVESIEYTENGSFVVRMHGLNGVLPAMHGLNGVLPARFFDDSARQKVLRCVRIKQSPLWKAVNN